MIYILLVCRALHILSCLSTIKATSVLRTLLTDKTEYVVRQPRENIILCISIPHASVLVCEPFCTTFSWPYTKAPVQLINIYVPFMEKGAKIINISSASSFQPVPYINLYAATKAFERSYSRALNAELKAFGITVTAVCPSWVDTEMLSKEVNGKEVHFPGIVTAEKVVKRALKDAKRGRDMSVCSLYVKCQHLNVKILPQKLSIKIWLHGIRKYL